MESVDRRKSAPFHRPADSSRVGESEMTSANRVDRDRRRTPEVTTGIVVSGVVRRRRVRQTSVREVSGVSGTSVRWESWSTSSSTGIVVRLRLRRRREARHLWECQAEVSGVRDDVPQLFTRSGIRAGCVAPDRFDAKSVLRIYLNSCPE